jgi:hypothetical protein
MGRHGMSNISAVLGSAKVYLPRQIVVRASIVLIALFFLMCIPAMANSLAIATSEGCVSVRSQVTPEGFKELDSTQFNGDERLYPSVRLFLKNKGSGEIEVIVRVAEEIEQLRCDFTISAKNDDGEKVRILGYEPNSFGWLNEKDKFERLALRRFTRACEKARAINPVLTDMPVFYIDRNSGEMTSLTHGGGCVELARSTAVGFLIATQGHSIMIKIVGNDIDIRE